MINPKAIVTLAMLRNHFCQNNDVFGCIGQKSHNLDKTSLQLQAQQETSSNFREAAVLLLIYPGNDGLELILTKRTEHLTHHAGQVSLPGGSVEDEDENHIQTALREAEEEIGLERELVEILGILEGCYTPSGFAITPIVALVPELPKLLADPGEVAEIFSIPLSLVLQESLYRRDFFVKESIKRDFYYIEFKEYYIWGATAKIMRSLALKLAD